MKLAAHLIAGLILGSAISTPLGAQTKSAGGIYTCIDSSGVRITSDRLIPQCMDREQRVLSPSGVERQRIGPVLSEAELLQRQEERRRQQLLQQRQQEQRKRDQALLARYPDRAAHDEDRRNHLQHVDALLEIARERLHELEKQEGRMQQELEFYAGDLDKAPARLRDRFRDLQQDLQAQRDVIATHETDRQRIQARFDEELRRLQVMWNAAKN